MEAATVGLDDQAGVSPEEVRLEPTTADVEGDVDLGCRKPTLAAHAQEHPLQFAACPLGLRMKLVENQAKPRDPAPTTTTPEQRPQHRHVENPQHLGLGKRLSQLPHGNETSQIEQRPLHCRTRNPSHPAQIAR